MRSVARLRTWRRLMLAAAVAPLLQVGTCGNLTGLEQDQVTDEFSRISAVVAGNLVANTVGFFLNNTLVRAGY